MKRLDVKQKPWTDDADENQKYAEGAAVPALAFFLYGFGVFFAMARTLGQRGLPQISAVRCLELKAETENAQLRCS